MRKTAVLLLALAVVFAACDKPVEDTVGDLASKDAAARTKAVERLGEDGEPYLAQLASGLSTNDADERAAIFAVMRRQGEKALPHMLDKIGYVWRDDATREGFTDYFRGLGETGYRALLDKLMESAQAAGAEANAQGSMVRLQELYHRFESYSLMLERISTITEVGKVPELLTNSYAKVRTRAAYLLCVKGWTPPSPKDAVIYYTHLISTVECPNAPEPVDDAARLAAADLPLFLEVETQFPADADARYRVLAATGTDRVADYVDQQARSTTNEFLTLNYFQVLKKMENAHAHDLAKKLLADPQFGASIKALDPRAGDGL